MEQQAPMNTVFAWMANLGFLLDDHAPDARHLAHIAAVRDAKRQTVRASSPISRLAGWLGFKPVRAATDPMTICCAA
jgi:hypothetical protein